MHEDHTVLFIFGGFYEKVFCGSAYWILPCANS